MAATVPLIADLEPIAGAGLAVSLAYLALERFRYRQAIEEAGKKVFDVFAKTGGIKIDDAIESYNDLKWLCRKECNGHKPRGFGPAFYGAAFRRQTDEIIVAILGCLAGVALVGGVALKIGRLSFLSFLDWPWVIGLFFYASVGAVLFPAVMVLCGRRCTRWGHDFADHCENQINKILTNSARAAAAPVVPPPPPPSPYGPAQATSSHSPRRSLIVDPDTGRIRRRTSDDPS